MKKLLAVGVVALVGFFALRSHPPADLKLASDRFWIDHEPKGMHEQFRAFFFSGEYPIGQFAVRTMWKGSWEGFHYHVVPKNDGEMDMLFGDEPTRERVKLRATPCNENGFDYCLDVTGSSRGVKRYYSKKEWQGTDAESVAQRVFSGR
jgi:hypothetical protein